MLISTEMDRLAELYIWLDGLDLSNGDEPTDADSVDLSEEARRRFKDSGISPLDNFSLKELDKRIAEVRAQIEELWNSALPKKEKYRQIQSKEVEISLLQAGQFTFARSMLSQRA